MGLPVECKLLIIWKELKCHGDAMHSWKNEVSSWAAWRFRWCLAHVFLYTWHPKVSRGWLLSILCRLYSPDCHLYWGVREEAKRQPRDKRVGGGTGAFQTPQLCPPHMPGGEPAGGPGGEHTVSWWPDEGLFLTCHHHPLGVWWPGT